jgi:hypothetical protein
LPPPSRRIGIRAQILAVERRNDHRSLLHFPEGRFVEV